MGRGAALGGPGSSSRGSSGAGMLEAGASSSSPALGSTPSEAGSQLLGQLGMASPAGPGCGSGCSSGAAAQAAPGGALGQLPLSPEGLPFLSLSSVGSGSLSPLPSTRNLLHGLLAAEGGGVSLASPAVAGSSGLLGAGVGQGGLGTALGGVGMATAARGSGQQGIGPGLGQQGLGQQGLGQQGLGQQGLGQGSMQGFSSFDLLQQGLGQGQSQGQAHAHAQQHNGIAGTLRGYGMAVPVSAATQLLAGNGLQQHQHLQPHHHQHHHQHAQQVVMGKAGLHARGLLVLQPSHDVTGGYAAPSNAGNMRY
jgi:hypothetical protein